MRIAFIYMNNQRNIGRGAGYVAGAILLAGHELTFYDTLYTNQKILIEDIIKKNYDVLMISSMTMLFLDALEIIRGIKRYRHIPTIVGGVHPTVMRGELLEKYPEIDYLCIGEGESFVIDFLRNLGSDSLYGVKNLSYRRNGKVFVNQTRPPEDLSKLLLFPWQLFRKEAIVEANTGFIYVNASRGCPYNCTYCANGSYLMHYGQKYLRYRPIADVVNELKYLQRTHRPKLFYFGDEMIFINREYVTELFQSIKHELNVPYGCMGRVENMDPQTANILKETGCRYVGTGIECGDEAFRKQHLNRGMTNHQIENAFYLFKKAGIFATSFNMLGFPFKNDDLLTEATIKLNQRIKPDYAQFTIFYPFPGTKLYERCVEMDLIDSQKLPNVKDYYTESVLKGVSLRKKCDEIDKLFNPQGFRYVHRKKEKIFDNLYLKLAHKFKKVKAQ